MVLVEHLHAVNNREVGAAGGGAGSELYQGLGAIMVGGLAVSTLFTLFLVPVLMALGYDAKRV